MSDVSQALEACFISINEEDCNGEPANVVDGMFAIARALNYVASTIKFLGNADAATPLGGMEALGMTLSESLNAIGSALSEVARAVDDSK